jgi:hypothetical protein
MKDSLITLAMTVTLGLASAVAVATPASATNAWVTNKSGNGLAVKVDDSSQSPAWVADGSQVILNASGRRVRIEPGRCTRVTRDVLWTFTWCNYGSTPFYGNFSWAASIKIYAWKL